MKIFVYIFKCVCKDNYTCVYQYAYVYIYIYKYIILYIYIIVCDPCVECVTYFAYNKCKKVDVYIAI